MELDLVRFLLSYLGYAKMMKLINIVLEDELKITITWSAHAK